MQNPAFLMEPGQFLDPGRLGILQLLLMRVLAPALWLVCLRGLGSLAFRTLRIEKNTHDALLEVMAGAVLYTLPFHVLEGLGVQMGPGIPGALVHALFGLGLVGALWRGTRPEWSMAAQGRPALWVAMVAWLFVVFAESRTLLPVFGDPLAFLVHAKQLIRSGFVLDSLEPRQQLYPDLLIHQMSFFSIIFRQDPTASLMALAPVTVGGLFFAWSSLVGRWTGGGRVGLLLAAFALMSARNPLRYGLVAGRYPYLMACMGLLVLLELVLRDRRPGKGVLAGFALAFVFLSHSGLIPLMLIPGVFLVLAAPGAGGIRTGLVALAASLALVLPRGLTMLPLMSRVPEGPEAQTRGWSSAGEVLIEPLRQLWGAVVVSPICQVAFVVSVAALGLRLRQATRLEALFWAFVAWAFVGGSGLFETLGLRGSLSHYGQRGYGLVVALVIAAGLGRVLSGLRGLRSGARWTGLIVLLMALHGLGFGRMLLRERFFKEPPGDSFRVLQRLKDQGERVGGLIPAAVLNGVIPFALTYGDAEYFPYFFPQGRMLVSFVPIPGFYRSVPEHVELYERWLRNPSDPAVIAGMRGLGLDTVWLPAVPQFESTLRQIEADPARYRPWFGFGRERVFRLVGGE